MVIFSPLNHCFKGLRHVFGLLTKYMRFNFAIYVSFHSAGLSLLIIFSFFNLSTPSFFLLLTSSASTCGGRHPKFWPIGTFLVLYSIPYYDELLNSIPNRERKYLKIVITTGKHLILLLMLPKKLSPLVLGYFYICGKCRLLEQERQLLHNFITLSYLYKNFLFDNRSCYVINQ